jgi:Domain of unknown function (DUF4232)
MRVRRGVTVFALTSVAAVLLASASAGRTSAPACRGGQLNGRVFDSNGAAGTIVLSVTLTNTGSVCSMRGYPALVLMNGNAFLPTRVRHGGLPILDQKPRLVVLPDRGVATVLIAYSDVQSGTESRCRASRAILVAPPGRLFGVTVAARAQACRHGTLHESPVLAGRRHAP